MVHPDRGPEMLVRQGNVLRLLKTILKGGTECLA